MMNDPGEDAWPIEDIQTWFRERGFELVLHQDADLCWADLMSIRTRQVLWPRYGRGENATEAANRARSRYRIEQ